MKKGEIMKKTAILLLSTAMAVSTITACGNNTTETTGETVTDAPAETAAETLAETAAETTEETSAETSEQASTYEDLIASLHAGQSYAYAPVCEGENALLVTSYVFDDLEGHQATYEAAVYAEKDGSVEKITTVQSGGTAYPIAVTDDNSLILSMRNSVQKGHVSKETGEYAVTEESNIDYSAAEDGVYHNFKDGNAEVVEDSSLYDELSEKYSSSEVLSFTKAGISADESPMLSGAVYAAYKGEDLYTVSEYYVFDSETSGSTQTPDGVSGTPFTYEVSGDDITFHFASADDTTEAKFGWEDGAFPTLTFTGDNETISLSCLGNADAQTFDAARYYDNDNNLYMQVKQFDETSLTGDLYREERINAQYVDSAKENDTIYSVNGTQFTVASFEEANKEIEYGTDEEFKKDVTGTTRFDGFIVKCSDDDFYYALEKEDYEQEYKVVMLLNEGNLRKLIEENVTFAIKENCEIYLQKFVEDGGTDKLVEEFILGREFKGDNYPGWSQVATEYYLTSEMLVAVSVIDGELYNFVQVYIP